MADDIKSFPSQPFLPQPDDPGFDEGTSSKRNRPASGARQVTPGEILSQGFQGSANAGDFLGLDMDFIGSGAGELELTGAPGSSPGADAEEDYDAEFDLDEPTQLIHADEGDLSASDTALESRLAEHDFALPHRPRKTKFVVGAIGLVAVGVAGYFFLSRNGDSTVGPGPQVAQKPSSAVQSDERGKGQATPPAPSVGDPSLSSTSEPPLEPPPVESYVEPSEIEVPAPLEPLAGQPEFEFGPSGSEPGDLLSGLDDLLAGMQPAEPVNPLDDATNAIASLFGLGPPPAAEASFPDFDSGFEWVSEDMLDMIWRGTDIPLQAISAPVRTLMPRVGMVRLHMQSGEIFEGRLYAVGQNMVWIDTEPGRIGLDGSLLVSYEHLAIDAPPTQGYAAVGGLVRVRVPGGVLDGRVLAQDGTTVTLVTEAGGKVTLQNASVEPLVTARAKVVQR